MKRHQRRQVLTFNKSQNTCQSDQYTQNRCNQVNNIQSVQNKNDNPLANLLCQYNSDSDTEDPKKDVQKLDDQVNDFFKEIQLIAPERSILNADGSKLPSKTILQSMQSTTQQTLWQECYDESTGYPYYWHIETNEVTWDMPEELQLIRKQSVGATESVKSSSQGSHWVDFSSIAYRQSRQADIPEGMIPQEVVARNRNRFIPNKTAKKYSLESKSETKNECSAEDDDSNDGRIEMITSFGSDGSDSEDENNVLEKKKATQSISESGNNTASYLKGSEVGPASRPTRAQSCINNLSHSYKLDLTKSSNISDSTMQPRQLDEDKIIEPDIKNNIVQDEKEFSADNRNKKDNMHNIAPKLHFNVSLVPGYGDDSDGEEDIRPKQETKPLFPISQNEEYTTNSLKDIHGIISQNFTESSNQPNNNNVDNNEMKDDYEKTECQESKTDEDKSKTNIFLEDMQICGKAFQRKKRIAFDVTSTKIKQNNVGDSTIQNDNNLISDEITTVNAEDSDEGTHSQLCTERQKECDEMNEEVEQCLGVKLEEDSSTKNELCNVKVPVEHKIVSKSIEEKDNKEMNDLCQIITEKLKFLSEGREIVSAVQTMQIQLQTLSAAWSAGSLEESYFHKWLANTSHELEKLEQDAAPVGWLCQWDRSHKRYYYYNTSTGTSQWTYPDTGIVGGTEEMELCTTPPPPESEELSITGSPTVRKTKEKIEEAEDVNTDNEHTTEKIDLEAPPPPQISNPSPPPPPKIFAEELKRNKRKTEKSDNEFLDIKKKHIGEGTVQAVNAVESLSYTHSQVISPQSSMSSNHANIEPLPPGVDLPDTSYETAALKGIIYSAASQQGNALYTSSIGDPTMPLISHQAALLQEPFIHYPAFHQHLHNHTTIAVAGKHGGQSAIQFMVGYTPIYTNNKIIAKPPVKASKESLGSALDSFYNDIARIERTETERTGQQQDTTLIEPIPLAIEEAKTETEPEIMPNDTMIKEKKKKKTRISISKKHKEMSTMVAKWQRVQKNLEDNA